MGRTRSEQMSAIRSKNTKPEVLLRQAVWASGLRYRRHYRTPLARSDFAFLSQKVAVFVDGCFWHGCPLHYTRPGTREEFWAKKLRENVERDRRQTLGLEEMGWLVLRVWEHEVMEDLEGCVELVKEAVREGRLRPCTDFRVVRVDVVDRGERVERRVLEGLREASVGMVEVGRRVVG